MLIRLTCSSTQTALLHGELLELERAPRDTLLDLIDTLDRQVASADPSTYALRDSIPSSNGSDLIAEKLELTPA